MRLSRTLIKSSGRIVPHWKQGSPNQSLEVRGWEAQAPPTGDGVLGKVVPLPSLAWSPMHFVWWSHVMVVPLGDRPCGVVDPLV